MITNYFLVIIFILCGCVAKTKPPMVIEEITKPQPRVHFTSTSDILDSQALRIVEENANWLKAHPRGVMVLEGHCDEWGEDWFNMELGDRRARRVKAALIAFGVPHDQTIMIVSHGESRPLDQHHTADAWRLNRRVEFILR